MKNKLFEMVRNGEKRPHWKSPERNALNSYTSIYDVGASAAL